MATLFGPVPDAHVPMAISTGLTLFGLPPLLQGQVAGGALLASHISQSVANSGSSVAMMLSERASQHPPEPRGRGVAGASIHLSLHERPRWARVVGRLRPRAGRTGGRGQLELREALDRDSGQVDGHVGADAEAAGGGGHRGHDAGAGRTGHTSSVSVDMMQCNTYNPRASKNLMGHANTSLGYAAFVHGYQVPIHHC